MPREHLINRITELEQTLEKIEERCKWLLLDCNEADKVNCHVQSITFEIAKVYPKYLKEGK